MKLIFFLKKKKDPVGERKDDISRKWKWRGWWKALIKKIKRLKKIINSVSAKK